ncbi:MAG: P-II family nitrogen regulator [Nitrososphaerales archaeon]
MKKVEATVRPESLGVVVNALTEAGFPGMTYYEVRGRGHKKGEKKLWRGQEYRVSFGRRIHLILLIDDEDADQVVDIIMRSTSTGEVDDGIICVTNVEELVKIRTIEKGVEAL